MPRRKKIDLAKIPEVQEEVVSIVSRQLLILGAKKTLSIPEGKLIVDYSSLLATIYKDYRSEASQIEKDLKQKSKEEILRVIKADSRAN